jgi:putative ABC transport system substrate-binding protein
VAVSGARAAAATNAAHSEDQEFQARLTAFLQGLQQLGWIDGRNVRIDTRWGTRDANLIRKYAAELVALGPDVIMALTSGGVEPLLQVTRTVPIVFAVVADPVGAGYVESMARPGGNVTGFTGFEYALGGKWLELLKEIVPGVARVAVLRDSAIAGGPAQFAAIQNEKARVHHAHRRRGGRVRGRAAISPALHGPNTASAENGWSCSKRSHRA